MCTIEIIQHTNCLIDIKEEFDVYGTWFDEDFSFHQEFIGQVKLKEEATFEEMPKELEINGFIYKLEDVNE